MQQPIKEIEYRHKGGNRWEIHRGNVYVVQIVNDGEKPMSQKDAAEIFDRHESAKSEASQ